MLRNILLGLFLFVVLVLAIGFVLPDKAHVERSIKIKAPASQIYALVDGFHSFAKWSPWQDKDPAMTVKTSGPAFGVGARYEWSGNKQVSSGTQEIVAETPYTQVKTKLTFGGFDGSSLAVFNLEPMQDGVRVTWSLDVPLGANPIGHLFGPLMKKQIGPDYELGLSRLKTVAEAGPKDDFAGLDAALAQSQSFPYAYVSASSSTDSDAIGKALMLAYGQVGGFMKAAGLKQAGAPLAVTRRWDEAGKVYEFDAGIPVDRDEAAPQPAAKGAPEVRIGHAYAGPALKVLHHGAYGKLPETYARIAAFKQAYGLQDNGLPWESYVSDPGSTPEAQLVTEIWLPLK